MKQILCYGDSNTWGYTAGTGVRYPHDVRWTGVMQRELGSEYTVLEEGLNGRTSVFDNPFSPHRSGISYLVKGFGIVNKAEIDDFLELSCFFHDPADVDNLTSGSSAFSKTSLNIRVHGSRIAEAWLREF